MNFTADLARGLAKQAALDIVKAREREIAKYEDDKKTNATRANDIIGNILNKIKAAASNGETYLIVDEKTGYNPDLKNFGPSNAIMGEPRKNKSLRCSAARFPSNMLWHHLAMLLEEKGFQTSFEESITSLDEVGRPVYMLVAYWD